MSDGPEVIDPMNWYDLAAKNRRSTIRWRIVLPIATRGHVRGRR